ncbi:MAG TPA: DNA translocase FtsK [Candidatus Saccharimonadales bacterium]|nr:DNA translocase FtsK [Candidatus Saccharimonadales bacterium]
MARSAPTRPTRKRTPSRRPASRSRSRVSTSPRSPLLHRDLRRELTGIGAIGAGVILAAVLILPGGGAVAGPVHDGLIGAFGIGAWIGVAGLFVTGARLCMTPEWRAGTLAALGSAVAMVAILGLIGMIGPADAGAMGRWIGSGVERVLGGAGASAALVVIAFLGVILATDLRTGTVIRALGRWFAAEGGGRRRDRSATGSGIGMRAFSPRASEPSTELSGVPMLLPFDPPKATPPAATAFLDPEEPQATGEDLGEHGFTREFEGVPAVAGEPAVPLIGPVPEVGLGHAAMISDEPEKVWVLPTAELLDTITGKRERLAAEVRATGDKIVSTLQSFGIETRIVGANSGPTVTQYELQPAVGVPVRRILGYQTDLALALAAPIRIQPFIPGKSAIGIEVPNKAAQLVSLKETIESPAFADRRNKLSVALGADVSGHPVIGDLTRMPHLLIAGATGSGKSVCINAVLGGFLLQATPAQLKMILIDPKRVELSNFGDLPHLLVPVVVEPEAAVASLRWAVKEMEERYKLFASHAARNIVAFNEKAPGLGVAPLPYIVIVIDELADLMMVAAGEIEDLICRIAQLARAVGLHLIVATQRPSADIITGLIKANIPSRVAFAVSSGVDSRVILDEMGAEKLLGRGDMLYLPIDEGKPRRLQGAFVSDRELDTLIGHWKLQGKPDYQEEIFTVEATVSWARDASKRDPLFAKAAHTVAAEGRAAASLLQRKLSVGYTRAARLIDQLAEHGVVGPFEGSKSRDVLMDVFQVDELLADLGDE